MALQAVVEVEFLRLVVVVRVDADGLPVGFQGQRELGRRLELQVLVA